jgi:triosephosphate isomerase
MLKRRRLIVGNWKMYGRLTSGLVLARDLAEKAAAAKPLNYDVVICPPATLTWAVSEAIMGTPLMLGGQDCHTATHGAHTGDISAAQLADLGCRYVIIGHSERRSAHGETNALVAQKVEAAQLAGLSAIICVGETAEQLASGSTADIIEKQLLASLPEKYRLAHLIVAYEPIWAIGSGQQPGPEDIVKVNKVIRKTLGVTGETVQILYGGSVSPVNAEMILLQEEVDGVLVGGASINADGFWAIAEKCNA